VVNVLAASAVGGFYPMHVKKTDKRPAAPGAGKNFIGGSVNAGIRKTNLISRTYI
jgi:hypothetical protein